MNKKLIDGLSSQCWQWPHFNREKFAELIVRECAGIYEGVYTDQARPERIDTRIKEHFGVDDEYQRII
jgi:hypothetical protein